MSVVGCGEWFTSGEGTHASTLVQGVLGGKRWGVSEGTEGATHPPTDDLPLLDGTIGLAEGVDMGVTLEAAQVTLN